MSIRIGINGFGRIGRVVFRAAQQRNNIEIVGINDLLDINYIAYLLKYDSTHGIFRGTIDINDNYLIVNGKKIRYTSEKNPKQLQWDQINADVIIEATGIFLTDHDARNHIYAGAKKVILTAPPKDNINMYVMGVNHHNYNNEDIISNASCTTNCVAPLAKIINDHYGIVEGLMTTVHAMTATQKTVDQFSINDWRGGRAASQNIIPSSTGATKAIGKIIPTLHDKLLGIAFRVPTINVSVVDLTIRLYKSSTYKNICTTIQDSANDVLKNILGYTEEEVVSSDFNGNTLTAIFDAKASIMLNSNFIKLILWYDNETGYSNKILDLITYITK
uniref:NAD-dependent glyceraldehyde-3-phosphate dehydrogenase n=1 Tax=Candidatus Aschnera chinzeii TaxID=1485666 RepID=A0AAT9G540_9ENTR|nr:MAG: glyceraldehyde-3-phosphate dehydrogenase [Candidatus Aschnera chinzeii]